jgi:long-chain acyl-CoA synthetase
MAASLRLPPEQLHAVAEAFGGERAYTVVGGSSLTFEQWDTDATRLARGLIDAGLQPGDRVAIHLEPVHALQWVTSYSAIHRAGAVAVPFNPQLARPEVERMLTHSGAAAAITEASLLPRYEGQRPAVLVAVPDGVEGPLQTAASDLGAVAWSDILSADTEYLQVPRDPGDLADILYTSGTTGDPKAVAIRHDNYSLMAFTEPNWSGGGWMHAGPH